MYTHAKDKSCAPIIHEKKRQQQKILVIIYEEICTKTLVSLAVLWQV